MRAHPSPSLKKSCSLSYKFDKMKTCLECQATATDKAEKNVPDKKMFYILFFSLYLRRFRMKNVLFSCIFMPQTYIGFREFLPRWFSEKYLRLLVFLRMDEFDIRGKIIFTFSIQSIPHHRKKSICRFWALMECPK